MRHAHTTTPRRRFTRLAAAGVAAVAVAAATLPAMSVAQAEQHRGQTVTTVASAQQHAAAKKKLKQRKKALSMLARVNAVRAKGATCGGTWYGPGPALRYNLKLAKAARLHAKDMGRHDYFDHYSRDGRSPTDRARAAGFRKPVGENVAAGYRTVADVMKGWLASEGHCANIMSKNYATIGIGFANVSGSDYGSYWVQDFGLR